MTEPIFKAPLPPGNSGFTQPPVNQENEQKQNLSQQDIKQKLLPYLWYVLGGTFVIGLILGVAMSGGEPAPVVQSCPIQRVRNPDIQEKYPLCGVAAKLEPCILYIMNADRYDHYAGDFFKEAQRLTERSDINISVENAVYSKLNIPPGYFAEIKIPSMR